MDLKSKNLEVNSVRQFLKSEEINGNKNEMKLPVFLVEFKPNIQVNEIYKVRRVCYCVITWEKYRNADKVMQCYRCQDYGHIANNCHKKPKCVVCAAEHN